MMKTHVPMDKGQFYTLGKGHAFACQKIAAKTELIVGAKFNMMTMLQMWELLHETKQVGFYFESPFTIENKGTFILTFMEAKRGKADKCSLAIRNDRDGLMVYDYPGVGSLAVSTAVNRAMTDILEMQ